MTKVPRNSTRPPILPDLKPAKLNAPTIPYNQPMTSSSNYQFHMVYNPILTITITLVQGRHLHTRNEEIDTLESQVYATYVFPTTDFPNKA